MISIAYLQQGANRGGSKLVAVLAVAPRVGVGGRKRLSFRGRIGVDRAGYDVLIMGQDRLTGASVGGLAVGAMGCFIFGLYLRRWLGERKALAGEPQRDMIA